MKKFLLIAVTVLMTLCMLGGCSKPQTEAPADTEPSSAPAQPVVTPSGEAAPTEQPAATPPAEAAPVEPDPTPSVEPVPPETEGGAENEGDSSVDSGDAAYAQQIARYYTAVSEQWDEGTYFEHEMSAMAAYYYEGNALENVGFTLMDINGDTVQELIIGAISNSDRDPLVFEIWTMKDGEPVMLAQSGSHNRYYLQYAEEDELWSVAYEAENGAANHAVYYLRLEAGKFEVIQGILFDAVASESAPWFMAYDLDWDVSNDTPVDEDTAKAVMEAGRNIYTAVEYLPYSMYR